MSKTEVKRSLPTIRQRRSVARSRLFHIEQVDLTFSNGVAREYERMKGSGRGAVMMIPLIDNDHMLLVREYAAGTHDYQLGFPKGLIDPGETPEEAADRELKEEIGYGSRSLNRLHQVHMAPTFFDARMTILIAQDLYPERLPGDEPEPLEVVKWPTSQIDDLLAQSDFTEARSIAALLLLERHLRS